MGQPKGADDAARVWRDQRERLRAAMDQLTEREKQVFALVVTGKLNKQIAARLGITERTVKAHRAQVMGKLQVTSIAELVRIATQLDPIRPQAF
jgi:RNA polymerase sigma factor (sigma-70 family)